MMTATVVAPKGRPNKRLTGEESTAYRARISALEWTQNEAARRIRKDPGLFSRWIRGELSSEVIRKKLDTLLAREEARRHASALRTPIAALANR